MNERELGNAVVEMAVQDYRWAKRTLERLPKSNRKKVKEQREKAEAMKLDCERFFNSDHFNIFTQLDGKALLEKLEQETDDIWTKKSHSGH